MNLNLIIRRFLFLAEKFLDGNIQAEDFKFAYYDIYYYEIEKMNISTKKEDEKIFNLFENFKETVSFYCPIPELRLEHDVYLDENQLENYTKEIVRQLYDYLQEFGQQNSTILKLKYLSDKTIQQLEHIILMSNRLLSLRLEKEDLIKAISEVLVQLEPHTEQEHKICETIDKYLNQLKDHYRCEKKSNFLTTWLLKKHPTIYVNLFPVKKDPAMERDPFIESLNELKEMLYFYLNPDFEFV